MQTKEPADVAFSIVVPSRRVGLAEKKLDLGPHKLANLSEGVGTREKLRCSAVSVDIAMLG